MRLLGITTCESNTPENHGERPRAYCLGVKMEQPTVTLAALLEGFRAAVDRWESEPDKAGDHGFRALFEALAWAGAVQDRLEDQKTAIPPTLNGLWCVRNRVL